MPAEIKDNAPIPRETPDSSRKKVYVNDDYTVTYMCPKCDMVITVNGLRYRDVKGIVDIKRQCDCGHLYNATLERRLYFRRKINIAAVYALKGDTVRKDARIKDISQCGLKLETLSDPPNVGDCLIVEFGLNDPSNTIVSKEATVRNRYGNYVGVEFYATDLSQPQACACAEIINLQVLP